MRYTEVVNVSLGVVKRCGGVRESVMAKRKPGPVLAWLQEHRVIRRVAVVAGIAYGVYMLGATLGWWERFLF